MDQQLDIKKIIWKKLLNRTYVLVHTKGSNVPASPGQKLSEKEFSQYPVHIVYSKYYKCCKHGPRFSLQPMLYWRRTQITKSVFNWKECSYSSRCILVNRKTSITKFARLSLFLCWFWTIVPRCSRKTKGLKYINIFSKCNCMYV